MKPCYFHLHRQTSCQVLHAAAAMPTPLPLACPLDSVCRSPTDPPSLSLKPQFFSDQPRFDPILLQSLNSTTLVQVLYIRKLLLCPYSLTKPSSLSPVLLVFDPLHRSGLLKRGNISPTPAATIHPIVHHCPTSNDNIQLITFTSTYTLLTNIYSIRSLCASQQEGAARSFNRNF